jgi:hypothetical protein
MCSCVRKGMASHFRKWHKCDLSRCPLCRRSRSIGGRNLDTAESTRMTRSRLSAPLIRSPRRMPIGNQRDAITKTCRSKRAYSFLICTRTLSNSVLAARAARSASRATTSAKVHCQATSGSLPSPPGCLTNISPAGSPIERRTAEALRRTSRTSAAKPGLA